LTYFVILFPSATEVYPYGAWCPPDEPPYTGGPECAGCHLDPVSCYYYYWFCVDGADSDCTNCHVAGGEGPPVDDFTDCTMAPCLTVTNIAGPNGTISPSGSFGVSPNSDVTLTFTPAAGYQVEDIQITKDYEHNGESVGPARSYTIHNITQNHIIESTFVALPLCPGEPVKIHTNYESTIQSAYDAIQYGSSATIYLHSKNFSEDLILNGDVTVTLKGGYDCDFTEPPVSLSSIRSMTINNGRVGIENIVLKE
jgi:hypothetical protein